MSNIDKQYRSMVTILINSIERKPNYLPLVYNYYERYRLTAAINGNFHQKRSLVKVLSALQSKTGILGDLFIFILIHYKQQISFNVRAIPHSHKTEHHSEVWKNSHISKVLATRV